MAIMRYEPWGTLGQLHKEIDRLFDTRFARAGAAAEEEGVACDWLPAIDIKEENDRFVIHADLPGVEPNDIDVNMENGVLTIKGQRESAQKEEREGYKRMERVRGTFFRRFTLPDSADAEKISAKARNGVLELVIPKHEKVQPRRISVEG